MVISGCWLIRVSVGIAQRCEPAQSLEAGQEKVSAAAHRSEGGQACVFFADWSLRDFELQSAVLIADERIALVAEFVETLVVHPHVLRELELADEARANHERR